MREMKRARALVVDDDAGVRGLLARVLADAGWVAESARDAAAALEALARRPFDLVTVDLRLPGMQGRELAAAIAERWPDAAVVIATGVADVATAVECLRDGAYDYLTKPFDVEDVVLRTRRVLERRRLLLESRRQREGLEARVKLETETARRLFLGAINSLSSALEAKDLYTRGHSERVSRIAVEIAGELGSASDLVGRVRLAGRLHDIGKIGVRESVLLKPGPLTREEYRHVQAHATLGERILAPVLLDTELVRIVRHHHEWYGGGGYPDGLRGSAIPLGARVLAVADAFDALTSDRPYRARMKPPQALTVLRNGAGEQWQPTLVEALAQRMPAVAPIARGEDGREGARTGEAKGNLGRSRAPDYRNGRERDE